MFEVLKLDCNLLRYESGKLWPRLFWFDPKNCVTGHFRTMFVLRLVCYSFVSLYRVGYICPGQLSFILLCLTWVYSVQMSLISNLFGFFVSFPYCYVCLFPCVVDQFNGIIYCLIKFWHVLIMKMLLMFLYFLMILV